MLKYRGFFANTVLELLTKIWNFASLNTTGRSDQKKIEIQEPVPRLWWDEIYLGVELMNLVFLVLKFLFQ